MTFADYSLIILLNAFQFVIVWCFIMIGFRLCIFGRNVTEVKLCCSCCILLGGTWFWHSVVDIHFDHLIKVVSVRHVYSLPIKLIFFFLLIHLFTYIHTYELEHFCYYWMSYKFITIAACFGAQIISNLSNRNPFKLVSFWHLSLSHTKVFHLIL